MREFWTVSQRDAALVRGHHVLCTAAKLGTGIGEVFFAGEARHGAFAATIGRPGIATEPTGEALLFSNEGADSQTTQGS